LYCKERRKIQQAALGLLMYNNVLFKLLGIYSLSHNTFLDDIKVVLSVRHGIKSTFFKGTYLAAKPRGVMVII